jgi:hypothetical protein
MLVELRLTDVGSAVDARAGFLKSDGKIVDMDGASPLAFSTAPPGNYYIVVRHRNHLAVMSASTVSVACSSSTYDFTSSQNSAYDLTDPYTLPMKDLGGNQYGMYAGDGYSAGYINYTDDSGIAWNERNQVGYLQSDYLLTSYVNYTDEKATAWNNRNIGTQVP